MFLNKETRRLLPACGIALVLFAGACKYDKEELLYPGSNQPNSCSTVPASFNANILPLVVAKCAIPGCHDATASGGLIFQNYNQVSAAKDQINSMVVVQKAMPPTGPLPTAEINQLRCWIEAGAINN